MEDIGSITFKFEGNYINKYFFSLRVDEKYKLDNNPFIIKLEEEQEQPTIVNNDFSFQSRFTESRIELRLLENYEDFKKIKDGNPVRRRTNSDPYDLVEEYNSYLSMYNIYEGEFNILLISNYYKSNTIGFVINKDRISNIIYDKIKLEIKLTETDHLMDERIWRISSI